MITVLIAQDPSLDSSEPRTTLCDAPDLFVLGTVEHQGLTQAVHTLQPDILVLDSMRLSWSAVRDTHRVTARCVQTHVVIVSAYAEHASLMHALRSGVAGVVLRPFEQSELIHAVREVASGRYHLSPRLWRTLEAQAEQRRDTVALAVKLTAAERQVLEMVAVGIGATGIAPRPALTQAGVKACCKTLMRKLGLPTHADLFVYALHWHIAVMPQRGPASFGGLQRILAAR